MCTYCRWAKLNYFKFNTVFESVFQYFGLCTFADGADVNNGYYNNGYYNNDEK